MRVKTTLVGAAIALLGLMILSGTAAADVIKVHPGQSIQAAINKADPGDTVKLGPGTYKESVQIKTDGITLKGAGDDETVLTPGPGPGTGICGGTDGICIADATPPSDPNAEPVINRRIEGVQIKDLTVRGFDGTGVFFFGTKDQRVSGVVADGNAEYGIAAFETTGGQYWDNEATGSGEAGMYVGDSVNADAVERDNVATDNGIGFFVRDSAHGLVEDNKATGNCIGVLVLDTPDDPSAPRPNHDWIVRDNDVNQNNKACSGEEGNFSGIGIAIDGAHRIKLVDNTANGNVPSGPSDGGSAGIAVLTEPGGPLATDNVIEDNTALGNSLDLFWDKQGTNRFDDNRCKTSDPAGLCGNDDDQGEGDHHGNGGGESNGNGGGDNNGGDQSKHHKHHKHHHHKHHRHNRHDD